MGVGTTITEQVKKLKSVFRIYYRKIVDGPNQIFQRLKSKKPLTPEQLANQYNGVDIPQWSTIVLNQAQFDEILSLSRQKYQENINLYICRITGKAMRQPATMHCCRSPIFGRRFLAEKKFLESHVEKYGQCYFCKSLASGNNFVELDDSLYNQILGFRQRLLKTYSTIPESEKTVWKDMIDDHFGAGYTQQHIESLRFT